VCQNSLMTGREICLIFSHFEMEYSPIWQSIE
jgi:hypothetical protein